MCVHVAIPMQILYHEKGRKTKVKDSFKREKQQNIKNHCCTQVVFMDTYLLQLLAT